MIFRLELEHPIVKNKNASILYGYPETILFSKGVIPVLWTQLIGKKQWSVTFHWIEDSIFGAYRKSVNEVIKQMESIEGVVKFSLVPYEGPNFIEIYREYMESGNHTRAEFDDKMEELLGSYID